MDQGDSFKMYSPQHDVYIKCRGLNILWKDCVHTVKYDMFRNIYKLKTNQNFT